MTKKLPNKHYEKLVHDHLWKYFQLHAKQRVNLFYYYLLISSAFVALQLHIGDFTNFDPKLLSVCISIGFLAITLIFWALENRNNLLVIYSKNALKQFEKEFIEESEYSVFKKDDDPDKRQKVKFKTTFFWISKHSVSFKCVFLLGIMASIVFIWMCVPHLTVVINICN